MQTLSLRPTRQSNSFNAILATVQGKPQIVTPSTSIVTKAGQKQFWTYIGHDSVLVVYTALGWIAQTTKRKGGHNGY